MRARPLAALALALALLSPPASRAQEPPAGAAVQAAPAATPPAQVGTGARSGLPRRPPPPRTMRRFWPVFAGFSLAWLGIVGHTLRLGARLGRIARAVHRLETERRGDG